MSDPAGRPAPRVGRTTRLLDTAALLLLVSGAALYAYAQYRTGQIAAGHVPYGSITGAAGGSNVDAVNRLATLSRVAAGLAIAGIAVGIAGFVNHTLKRPPAPHHEQADHSRPS